MESRLDAMGRKKDIPPIEIPDHELISLIGEGSYGQVWIARNTIGTYRAVKIVLRDSFRHERPFEREIEGIRRFEPVSRTHTGLVAILHVGQSPDGNCFYYVMELGDDVNSTEDFDPHNYQVKSLASAVWDNGRLPVDRCIELGLSLSDALGYLHEQDLIHRDVKPANIIFVAGYPKLADIGLVAEASAANTFVGTEGFIPPEGPNSEQADVYSLGKTLYEIATGQDRNQFPELPASIVEEGPDDGLLELIEIINQACHHDRSVRYRSARAMHAEITALANGRSIRRLRLLERRMSAFSRFIKVAVLVLLPLVIVGFMYHQDREARLRETNREIGALEVDAARDMDFGHYAAALRKVSEAWALAPDDGQNVMLQKFRASQILAQIPPLTHYWLADSAITSMRFSQSGEYLYVGGDQGLVARYRLAGGDVLRLPGHIKDVRSIDLHEKEGLLVSAGDDRVVKLWDLSSGENVAEFRHPVGLWAVRISPDGKTIVSGGDSTGDVCYFYVWDVDSAEEPRLSIPIRGGVRGFDFSPDGQLLAVASGHAAHLFHMDHLAAGKPFGQFGHASQVFDVRFLDGATRLATAAEDGSYRVFELGKDEADYESPPAQFGIRGIHESPDNRYIATAGWDSTVQVVTRFDKKALNPRLFHSGRVNTVRFGPHGHRLAAGASDGTIRIWDLAGRRVTERLSGPWQVSRQGGMAKLRRKSREVVVRSGGQEQRHDLDIEGSLEEAKLVLSESGDQFAVFDAGADRPDKVVVVGSMHPETKQVALLWQVSEPIEFFDVSPDQRLIALGGQRHFQLFDRDSGEPIWAARSLDLEIAALFFSPSSDELVVQHEKEVRVLSCLDLSDIGGPYRTGFPIVQTAIDPSNEILAVSNSDGGLEERSSFLFKYRSSKAYYAELRHRDGVNLSIFDNTGARVMTASEDATAKVWATDTGRRMFDPIPHRGGMTDAVFSPDGEYVLTACQDRTVRIWNASTGIPVSPPIEFSHDVGFIGFEERGLQLICQNPGGSLTWRWSLDGDVPPPRLLEAYARVLNGDQLDWSRSKESVLSGWSAIKEEAPDLVETDLEELLAWHRHQLLEATLRLFQLPDLYEDEDFEFWEKVEKFHLQRLRQLTGQSHSAEAGYMKLIHEIVENRRLQERLKQ